MNLTTEYRMLQESEIKVATDEYQKDKEWIPTTEVGYPVTRDQVGRYRRKSSLEKISIDNTCF